MFQDIQPAIRQSSTILSRLMSELIPFLCLKLYSLNFAIAHAQWLLGLSEFVILVLIRKKTVLPLETSSEINFELIKCVKNVKSLPLTKQIENIKYLVIFNLSRFSITFFLLPNQVDVSGHCSYHFSTRNVLRLRCNNTLIFLWRFQC